MRISLPIFCTLLIGIFFIHFSKKYIPQDSRRYLIKYRYIRYSHMAPNSTPDSEKYISIEEAARLAKKQEAYIRQLCRTGKLDSTRQGKNWHVKRESLSSFLAGQEMRKIARREQLAEKRHEEYKDLNSGGIAPITVADAARELGVDEAYARELCRSGKVKAQRIGATWYINRESISSLLVVKSYHQALRREKLARERIEEYARTNGQVSIADSSGHQYLKVRFSEAVATPLSFLSLRYAIFSIMLIFIIGTFFAIKPLEELSYEQNFNGARESQFAAVGDDTSGLLDVISRLVRSWSSTIDSVLYGIAFPRPLVESGAVVANITVPQRPSSESEPKPEYPTVPGGTKGSTVVVNQPVIERIIERQLLASQGGITEEILNARIEALDAALSNKIYSLTSANTTVTNNTYETPGAVARSDNFDDINIDDSDITDSRISGGTIDGATITGGSVTATAFSGVLGIPSGGTGTSTSPSYGNVLLGNSAGGYDLVATSSLGISGGSGTIDGGGTANLLSYWTDSDTLAATSSPTAGYYVATSSTASIFPFASTTGISVRRTASTSNQVISSVTSGSLLKTTTGGAVIAAVAGTDYVTGSSFF